MLAACQPAAESPEAGEPVAFRSVLDGRPRMLTLQLADRFWVAYSAENGGLYRIWQDGVNLDGAVYTTAHGPQPTSVGPAYAVAGNEAPWQLVREGAPVASTVQYRGHAFEDGRTQLRLQLRAPLGETIDLTETPAYVEDADGRPGLQRTFTTSNLPEGATVAVSIDLNSLAGPHSYATDGAFEVVANNLGVLQGRLTLAANGATTFSSYFGEPAVPVVGNAGPEKPAGLALIERSDCVACHNAEVQTVGPSYKAIAEKYGDSELMVVRLASKVIPGGNGVWGEAMMTPHPTLPLEDAKTMVGYILSLGGEASTGGPLDVGMDAVPFMEPHDGPNGLAINMYPITGAALTLEDMQTTEAPYYSGIVPVLHAPTEAAMGPVQSNIYAEAKGFLNIPETDNYVLRIVSDDGGRLYLDGELLIDNAFSVIPTEALSFERSDLREAVPYEQVTGNDLRRPGDQLALDAVHPSFSVETIRPDSFTPKVGGMDILPDGRILVSTWDAEGGVYLLSNIDQGDRSRIQVKQIARGLAEPLGLKVVDGKIYVIQKQELTRLLDTDGDEVIDVYETVANGWGATANFHEFAFGLVYKDGFFYATLATAILPGGASANPQNPDRGKVVRIAKDTGEVTFMAKGLRTPNGIGEGVDGEFFIADNQGDWLPASKIVHVSEGAFYSSRSVDFAGTEGLAEKPPVVWLPQDEIGNSPSQPIALNAGPYQGQMIHGEVTHGGIKRVFVEQVDGQYQGALFRFTQGLEAGVNRLAWGPDGKLYIGGVGNPGNWGHVGKNMYGLQRMTYTGAPVFEMLAVRMAADGFEIEFTEPLAAGVGEGASDYGVRQWRYQPTINYGGPKLDEKDLAVTSIVVSADRKKARLTVEGMQAGHLVYIRLNDATMRSEAGRTLWSTEAWYTLNRLPAF